MNKYTSNQKGLSFIEAMIVISVSTILMVAITSTVANFYRYNAFTIEQTLAVNAARKGIEEAVGDIREAAYSEEGGYPIVSAATSTFSFYSDVNTDNNVEFIRLFLDPVTLEFKKGVTSAGGTPLTYVGQPELIFILGENVKNIEDNTNIFTYYRSDGTQVTNLTANLLDISFVQTTIITNVNPNRAPNDFTLTSSATIRNLKSNL